MPTPESDFVSSVKIRIFAPDYQRVTNYEKISKKTYRQRT